MIEYLYKTQYVWFLSCIDSCPVSCQRSLMKSLSEFITEELMIRQMNIRWRTRRRWKRLRSAFRSGVTTILDSINVCMIYNIQSLWLQSPFVVHLSLMNELLRYFISKEVKDHSCLCYWRNIQVMKV